MKITTPQSAKELIKIKTAMLNKLLIISPQHM